MGPGPGVRVPREGREADVAGCGEGGAGMLRPWGWRNWGPGPDACGDGKEGNRAEGRRGPAWRRRASRAEKECVGWGWGHDWGTDVKDRGQGNILLSSHSPSGVGRGKEEEEFGPPQGRKGRTRPHVPLTPLPPTHTHLAGCT